MPHSHNSPPHEKRHLDTLEVAWNELLPVSVDGRYGLRSFEGPSMAPLASPLTVSS